MACEFLLLQQLSTPVHIHVDCQSVLYALQAPYITSGMVKYTADLLSDLTQGQDVTLQWVKAHIGIPGNEEADTAAKAGSRSNRKTLSTILPPRKAWKNQTRKSRNLSWTKQWAENPHCRQTKLFLKGPQPRIWIDMKPCTQNKISRIVRFITGHCFMNRHNTLIDKGYAALDDPEAQCRLCEEAEESPAHLITECPVLNNVRVNTLYSWQLDTPPPWSPELIKFIDDPNIIALEETQTIGI